MGDSRVIALHYKSAANGQTPSESLELRCDKGIVGDAYYGHGSRQVLMLSKESLDAYGYAPGSLREQILIDFPGLQNLPKGARLRVGQVEMEVEGDCAPCHYMAKTRGEDPADFVAKMAGKRGMFVFIRGDGVIRVGDEVTLIES